MEWIRKRLWRCRRILMKNFLKIFTKDRSFYKTFFPLLAIIVLQQLAALAVNMADNIMLGRYTELSLSGATLVNQIQFTLQQIAAGIGMGIVVLASQYWGQHRIEPIKKYNKYRSKTGACFWNRFLCPEPVFSRMKFLLYLQLIRRL